MDKRDGEHKDEDGIVCKASKLCEDISSLYKNQTFSDVTLVVEGQRLHVHKVILAARSEYFEALLFNGMKESTQAEITINDAPFEAFCVLLKYIYSGTIIIVVSNLSLTLEVLVLAQKFMMEDLKSSIIKKIIELLNLENVIPILNIATLHDLSGLSEHCCNMLAKNAMKVLAGDSLNGLLQISMIKLLKSDSFTAPEFHIFKAIERWCKVNTDVDGLVVQCLRLSQMNITDIMSTVWPSKLVRNDLLLDAIAEIGGFIPVTSNPRTSLIEVNVCTSAYNAEVITGMNTASLLSNNKDPTIYAHHVKNDTTGITIKLGVLAFINHIHMRLYDVDSRSYGYYIEVSIDQKKWKTVIDYTHYICRSCQDLYFEGEIVQYIRVVGIKSSIEDDQFRLVSFEAEYKTETPKIVNGIVCPNANIATHGEEALVTEEYNYRQLLNSNAPTSSLGQITIQLAQPYMVGNIKTQLCDGRNKMVIHCVETSTDYFDWRIAVDHRNKDFRGRRTVFFSKRPVVFIRITGSFNSTGRNLVLPSSQTSQWSKRLNRLKRMISSLFYS